MTAAGESIPIQGPQADPGQPISSNSNQSKKVSKSKTALQSICILSLIFGVVGLFVLPNTMFIHPIILSSGSFMVFGATSLYLLIYPSFNKLEKPKKNIDDKEKDQLCLFATQKIAPFIKPLNLSHRALDKYQIEDKNSEYTKSHWITQAGKEIIDISSPPTPTKTKNTTKTTF